MLGGGSYERTSGAAGQPLRGGYERGTPERTVLHELVSRSGKSQRYGTQYRKVDGRWALYDVDASATDEDRAVRRRPGSGRRPPACSAWCRQSTPGERRRWRVDRPLKARHGSTRSRARIKTSSREALLGKFRRRLPRNRCHAPKRTCIEAIPSRRLLYHAVILDGTTIRVDTPIPSALFKEIQQRQLLHCWA